MKKLFVFILVTGLAPTAFGGEVWRENYDFIAANVMGNTGWQSVRGGSVVTDILGVETTGSYCHVKLTEKLEYTTTPGGRVFTTWYNNLMGGYWIREGRVAQFKFGFYQTKYQPVNCTLHVIAKDPDGDTGGGNERNFSYEKSEHQAAMLQLKVLLVDLQLQRSGDSTAPLSKLDDLRKWTTTVYKSIQNKKSYRAIRSEFLDLRDAYVSFANDFNPSDAELKESWRDAKKYYENLKSYF